MLISSALLIYWLLLIFVQPLIFVIFSNNPRIALAAAFIPVAGAIGLLFMQESRSQIGFAYPRRMFWLPVHTYALVAAQFVYKLAIVAILSAAAGWICASEIKHTFAIMPQVTFFTGLTATLLGMVFLVCGYGSGTGLSLFIPAAAISYIGFHHVYSAVSYNILLNMPPSLQYLAARGLTPETGQHLYYYPKFSNLTWWCSAAVLVWWAIVSYVAARHGRSEVPGDRIGRWVRMVSNVAYLDRDNDRFASPEAAHRWFEWRRVIYLYPWITIALGLLLVTTLRTSAEEEENKFIVSFALLGIAPAITSVIIGYAMTRPDPGYMWFVGGRPLATGTISKVRIMVSLKAIATAYGLALIAYTGANMILFGGGNPLAALVTDLQLITTTNAPFGKGIVMLAAAIWIVLTVIWSLFWMGRVAGVAAWIAGAIAAGYFYWDDDKIFASTTGDIVSPVWVAFGGTLTALMVCGVIGAYVWSAYRGLISVRLLPILVAITVITVWAVYQFQDVLGRNNMPAALIWLLVPLAPFASIPATLAWQRHR
jgi:hypothetical protein